MIRVCPKRDAKCPHGMKCPFTIDRYSCKDDESTHEFFEGKWRKVLNPDKEGWWRYADHYDRNGYCDNPARGY